MAAVPPSLEVAPAPVLLVGDPRLRQVSLPVEDVRDGVFRHEAACLVATLRAFRAAHGFGRAIAAPQIGVLRRFIAADLGRGPFLVVNPEVTWASDETFTLWDDCLSFPSLLVKLRRCASISLRYLDEQGRTCAWERLERAAAELFQHELDHLDGVLFTDRALDRDSLVLRPVFEAEKERLRAQVDYVIGD